MASIYIDQIGFSDIVKELRKFAQVFTGVKSTHSIFYQATAQAFGFQDNNAVSAALKSGLEVPRELSSIYTREGKIREITHLFLKSLRDSGFPHEKESFTLWCSFIDESVQMHFLNRPKGIPGVDFVRGTVCVGDQEMFFDASAYFNSNRKEINTLLKNNWSDDPARDVVFELIKHSDYSYLREFIGNEYFTVTIQGADAISWLRDKNLLNAKDIFQLSKENTRSMVINAITRTDKICSLNRLAEQIDFIAYHMRSQPDLFHSMVQSIDKLFSPQPKEKADWDRIFKSIKWDRRDPFVIATSIWQNLENIKKEQVKMFDDQTNKKVDWTDITSLNQEQAGELMDIIHDSRLQRQVIDSGDPRAYIIFDLTKQKELWNHVERMETDSSSGFIKK